MFVTSRSRDVIFLQSFVIMLPRTAGEVSNKLCKFKIIAVQFWKDFRELQFALTSILLSLECGLHVAMFLVVLWSVSYRNFPIPVPPKSPFICNTSLVKCRYDISFDEMNRKA
jgi:hypothetical protein